MKLSIILPVASYNVEWLDQSILSTAGLADELVVVADEGCEFHPAFQNNPLVHQVITIRGPRCLASALNAGIAASGGDWFCFHCSDDYFEPAGMLKIKQFAAGSDFDIVGGVAHSFGMLGENLWPRSGDISQLETICCITSPALQRKTVWWKVGGYEHLRYLDWHYWKKAIKAGCRYHFCDELMFHYRCWPGTINAKYGYNDKLGHEWGNGPREH